MKNFINIIHTNRSQYNRFKYRFKNFRIFTLLCYIITLIGCSDFVEVDPPKNTLVSETVFKEASTVKSALANVYFKMREEGMVSGNFGLGLLMSSYSDELDYYQNNSYLKIYNHTLTSSDETALSLWTHAYNIIYSVNDIINGVNNSGALTVAEQEEFKGQALFVRGFMHSLLVELYGDVPYITTTNYLENNVVERMPQNSVYENIISDLNNAINLLDDTDTSGENVIPNKSAAEALLARVYLYTENWEMAETIASEVISKYNLELDITKVFLKESPETIWQFKPNSTTHNNTYEAIWLIIQTIPGQNYALTNNLLAAFELGDLRRSNWVGSATSSDGLTTLQYAYKYRAYVTETQSLEYSIVFRLAEQYLIRAEARAHQGNISGAQQDLNAIRNRAGLANTTATTENDLLEAILQERHVELFTEYGHRWFDLKRTGKASEVLSPIKINWRDTDILFPIPANEIQLNSNLKPQNPGY
ncbi:RagB/SusD family nutrient uptake outer membrane protein [Flavivirga sp. 57AJ16]|uniref:RagB/SusD family nutrient uptake outer membrane protein n=1 Tax=Flavivirga sp. 57AJ16 TaxID=3025307 RepID=UPI0023657734|nr:RagB/SusD family nutrient uptake outer membrane protein [Flavivirga sp. 57AJ16]MDD7888232.1 RagB/SusD family nutrient uptake outer membrane protein [Flavivirga sp. 57AJ16]